MIEMSFANAKSMYRQEFITADRSPHKKLLFKLAVTIFFAVFASQTSFAFQAITQDAATQTDDVKTAIVSIDELMANMTLEEKIGQLNLLTPGGAVTGTSVSKDVASKIAAGNVGGVFGIRGIDRVRQLQEIAAEQSRLKIPLLTGMDVIHGHETIFPIPLALSCSWDMELIEATAKAAAKEATADGLMWTFSPMVDIARDPRWGRIAEGAGEDPFLGSAIAAAMVRGYQGEDLTSPTTMLSCVKHFANYGAPEGGRDYATVDMSQVRMHNEYLPPYKAAIDAGVGSVMTSFNVVDYIPASGNQALFKDLLRDRWGFDELVVTDYTSINEMTAHGLGDLQRVSAMALNAAVDMDMVGEGFFRTLKQSLEAGDVTQAQIDAACRRVLQAKADLGLFEDAYRYCDAERGKTDILSESNRNFAREVAAQSFVLLKNEEKTLPLKKQGTIGLIGPLADSSQNMLGTWSVSGDAKKSVSVMAGMKRAVGDDVEILYAKGCNISDDPAFAKRVNTFAQEIVISDLDADEMIKEAIEVARKSDVVVAVMGESSNMSGESSSMADIRLQPAQRKLLKALAKIEKPIVLVLFNGRPMTIKWESENMDAILDVWFGGTEAGNAVADVLFGEVNPGGKLTTSFPVSVGQIPVYHSMLNSGRPYNGDGDAPKFTSNYLDIPNKPLYAFGHGLSYTTFEYGPPTLTQTEINDGETIYVSIEVTNTGDRAGTEVVQMYLRDVAGSISRPMKELKGFEKIELAPQETKKVSFEIDQSLLSFFNSDLEFVAEPGMFELFIGGNSVDVQKLEFELK